MRKALVLIAFILVTFAVHLVGQLVLHLTPEPGFTHLRLPAWGTSPHEMARIWASVFVFNAIPGALFYLARSSRDKMKTLFAWFVQLVINAVWHILYFHYRLPTASAIAVTIVFVLAALACWWGRKVDRAGTLLMIPYLIGLTYASVLGWMIVGMNR
jgi:tryptophan-rich sensory protein